LWTARQRRSIQTLLFLSDERQSIHIISILVWDIFDRYDNETFSPETLKDLAIEGCIIFFTRLSAHGKPRAGSHQPSWTHARSSDRLALLLSTLKIRRLGERPARPKQDKTGCGSVEETEETISSLMVRYPARACSEE
jgi:hypothetical protein